MTDDTEIGIDALTKDLPDDERRAASHVLRRNSLVAKAVKWAFFTICSGVLAGIGAELTGIINILG
jgi:hypothetical protein